MDSYKSLTHSKYDCKYHIVFVSKGRKKTLFGKIRKYLKGVFHELARQFGDKQRNFNGENLWACGYAVSTVGFELEKIKDYIAHQEKIDSEQEEGKF